MVGWKVKVNNEIPRILRGKDKPGRMMKLIEEAEQSLIDWREGKIISLCKRHWSLEQTE